MKNSSFTTDWRGGLCHLREQLTRSTKVCTTNFSNLFACYSAMLVYFKNEPMKQVLTTTI